jgi:uncharacterized membrane protein (UPF0127 family)
MSNAPQKCPPHSRVPTSPSRRGRRAGALAACILVGIVTGACGSRAASQDADPNELSAGSGGAAEQVRTPEPGHAWVIFGADTVTAEVARTPEERAQGLMYREELEDGRGMLFVFDRAELRSFWMQNTYIPLDIAYIDAGRTIVDILPMEPLSDDLYESSRPALFALEVPQGWFADRGIEVGARAEIVFGP